MAAPKIDPELAPLLFEPFRRLGNEPAGSQGAGLGLSIVRSVAAAHHGTVLARSRPAGGLDVSVLLPEGVPASSPIPVAGPASRAITASGPEAAAITAKAATPPD
jgi:hypothetical protein